MFLAAVALIGASATDVWRCYDEVFDLALLGGKVVAATSGGPLIERSPGVWRPLGSGAPAGLRKLLPGDTLRASDRAGRVYEFLGAAWRVAGSASGTPSARLPMPSAMYRGGLVRSAWGSQMLVDEAGNPKLPRSPTPGDYALLAQGERLLAGTPEGIYEFLGSEWKAAKLPTAIESKRPQGYAELGTRFVVGGIDGLRIGRPGQWQVSSEEPVRQMLQVGASVWVLRGSGAVDKLDLAAARLYPDALYGSAKRPWTSCLAVLEGGVGFGSMGGWVERQGDKSAERYPAELGREVVTAIAGSRNTRWIGTQGAGLFRFTGAACRRFNPGTGLPDAWVTALAHDRDGLVVGTAGSGLFLVNGDSIRPIDSPTNRVRHLARFGGKLVVGGMDGAWIRSPGGWRMLPTQGEETTAVVSGKRLIVCTDAGIFFVE